MKASRVRPSDIALLALTAATLVFFGLWQMGSLEAKADRIELRRIRAERLMASIDSAGWEARLVDATEGLEAQLQEARESGALLAEEKADLAAEVETLGGELRAMADMYVELAGSIRTHDATVHVSDTAAVQPDSVTAPVDDGLLRGKIAFFPPSSFDLDYRLQVALALGWIDAPDGRLLITARATDSRVGLSYGDVFYQPPAPVAYCSVGEKARWATYGAGALELGQLVAGVLNR